MDEARKVIYPGSNGDAWWDMDQLLVQTKHAIEVFEKQFPGCVALFIYDQSSAHGSLGPDALRASSMNKTDGGKQRVQHDTTIPMSNPNPELCGQPQKMTLDDGTPKGMETVLTERGYDVTGLKARCSPVYATDSPNRCCMSRFLSKEEDFANQESMLEKLIREAGHLCIFLPKFHCELNPIEMVFYIFSPALISLTIFHSTGDGQSTDTEKFPNPNGRIPKQQRRSTSTSAHQMLSNASLTDHGAL